jgi:hypothetical protein
MAGLPDRQEEPPRPSALVTESEFEFFSRRALEEARLAQQAENPAAANAHRYLAAAYSEQLAKHIKVHAELEELLSALP